MKAKHWTALTLIGEFTRQHGYAPTALDLSRMMECSPSTASSRIKELAARGYVRLGDHRLAGAYALTEKAEAVSSDA